MELQFLVAEFLRQNMAWRKYNRQKKNYAEYTAGTQTIGHFRIARAVSQGSKVHSWN